MVADAAKRLRATSYLTAVKMADSSRKSPNLDTVTTINDDGSHYVLHPADVRGRFTVLRRIVAAVMLFVYVALPWITINGNPAVFLDVANRRFHLFGLTLAPQDLWVLFFLISGLGFGLFFITALLGRLWCGWACPYTIFLEHIFRRVERLIDGDAPARRRLAAAPWTWKKAWKRILKHGIYLVSAALIAHIFLSYFVSLKNLYQFMRENPLANLTPFAIVTFLTLVLYGCFAFFREQFCIIMCPYGRLQSLLTDDDTMIIGYDETRGEPRGPKGKVSGDCIDCRRCVNVCPTGIDIRNGLQIECIGCSACVDACDEIMVKVDRPKGLIRYDSMNGLEGKKRRVLRPRIFLYLGLACLGTTALVGTVIQRARPYTWTVTRMQGPPHYTDGTSVRNHYQVLFINKRNQPATVTFDLVSPPPGFALSGADKAIAVTPGGELQRPAIIICNYENFTGPTEVQLRATANPGDVTLVQTLRFIGPNPNSLPKATEP
jgi:cytochrome c oxidase accessory protein FixG